MTILNLTTTTNSYIYTSASASTSATASHHQQVADLLSTSFLLSLLLLPEALVLWTAFFSLTKTGSRLHSDSPDDRQTVVLRRRLLLQVLLPALCDVLSTLSQIATHLGLHLLTSLLFTVPYCTLKSLLVRLLWPLRRATWALQLWMTSGEALLAAAAAAAQRDCPICLEAVVMGAGGLLPHPSRASFGVMSLCGHVFHAHCLRRWLEVGVEVSVSSAAGSCPVCRQHSQPRYSWIV